jgi:hypothetical protein
MREKHLSSPRGSGTPQPPGRTRFAAPAARARSHSANSRASGTTMRSAREGGSDMSGGHEAANGPVT